MVLNCVETPLSADCDRLLRTASAVRGCVAKQKQRFRTARLGARAPGDAVGIQVPIGRIGAKRTIEVGAGTSVDVLGKKIRVKAGTGGDGPSVEGWYVLVS